MSQILFNDDQPQADRSPESKKAAATPSANIFQGRFDANSDQAAFPEWDILPPNQFINPRMKQQ
jgi:hypothetical protein